MSAVTDNAGQHRFELEAQGELCFIDYRRQGSMIIMTHAEVPPALNGRGLGSQLVKGALELVRSRKETVVPRCSFVAAYIMRHPEYKQLLAS